MAEIRVEPQRRSMGWLWVLIILLILVIAGWWFFSRGTVAPVTASDSVRADSTAPARTP